MPFDVQDFKIETDAPVRKIDATLDGLIAWLETQDPSRSYEFISLGDCLFARFCLAQGFRLHGPERHHIEDVYGEVAQNHPNSNGSALVRARALRESGR